jgi:hypothetical protein
MLWVFPRPGAQAAGFPYRAVNWVSARDARSLRHTAIRDTCGSSSRPASRAPPDPHAAGESQVRAQLEDALAHEGKPLASTRHGRELLSTLPLEVARAALRSRSTDASPQDGRPWSRCVRGRGTDSAAGTPTRMNQTSFVPSYTGTQGWRSLKARPNQARALRSSRFGNRAESAADSSEPG